MTDLADSLSGLLNAINRQLKDVPPGPEREARLRAMAEAHLKAARSRQETLFWEGFLRQVPEGKA